MDSAIRRELFRRRPVSRQAMNQRAKRLKDDYGPMTTDEAMYVIAHQEHVDLAKHLNAEMVAHIRDLVDRINSLSKSQYYLTNLRRQASASEARMQLRTAGDSKVKSKGIPRSLPNQDWDFIEDKRLKAMLARDYSELRELFKIKAPKSTLALCGSMLEAVLVSILQRDETTAREKHSELFPNKKKPERQAPPIDEWELYELISVSAGLNILDDDSRRIADALRGYRNVIHPMVEIRRKTNLSDSNIVDAMVAFFKHILLVLSTRTQEELSPIQITHGRYKTLENGGH